jgi:1-acyl-sn-glycerol-3-phosphate acyltransferase
MTIFRTPLVRPLLALLSRGVLRLLGWRVVGEVPAERRFVLIGAPHTSNWDFPLMIMAVLVARLDVHWMGKHTLFPRPLAGFMKWLGGVPIDRRQANNTVEQMIDRFGQADAWILLIPPEGTRARVERWKTGFYHIAHGAGVPVVRGFIDASRRELGFGPAFVTTGELDADLVSIQQFYADKRGLR